MERGETPWTRRRVRGVCGLDEQLWPAAPPACAACDLESCQTPFTAPPGTYRLYVEVYAPLPDCGAACECELPGQAHCVLQQPALEPKPAAFSIDIEHPNQPDVLIAVQ